MGGSITEGMSDDGEPSGTSGPPALAVLRGADVGDTVIVITRYFGGTKLGTGGLVAAYGASAKLVIAAMETIEKVDRVLLRIQIPYALQERVRTVFETCDALIETTEYASEVTYTLQLPCDVQSQFSEAVKNLSGGRLCPRDNRILTILQFLNRLKERTMHDKKYYTLVVWLLLGIAMLYPLLATAAAPDWENPEMIGQNKEAAHCTHIPFIDAENALQNNVASLPFYPIIKRRLEIPLGMQTRRASRGFLSARLR